MVKKTSIIGQIAILTAFIAMILACASSPSAPANNNEADDHAMIDIADTTSIHPMHDMAYEAL